MIFEIKYKDARGRAGILKTPHGKVKTPALMPVIHPGKQTLDVKKYGTEMVITNAYLIYKNEDLRVKALDEGVHNLIHFPGPIVTDSGSFQLSEYGDIEVSNKEIIEFQEKIGTDIGTSLDIPTPPFVKRERAEKELNITIERAKEALSVRNNLIMNSVVQGSTYADLRAKSAQTLGSMDFEVHPIGAVVPLMESYRYSTLLDVIMASVKNLPDSRPRHLMGAGHPMIFAFTVALGCDLFDSAAYILYAQDDRLLMPNGTHKLENLYEMPCSCEVCTSYTPEDLKKMEKDERVKLIAQHNLQISFAEIRQIRQALAEGSLWELVEERCRVHPYLLDALRNLKKYTTKLEKYDPPHKKSAFFYSGPESLHRTEVLRHLQRLSRLPISKRLLILPPSEKPYSKNISLETGEFYSNIEVTDLKEVLNPSPDLQIAVVDVPFSIIPLEIEEVYPLAQNVSPSNLDEDAKKFVREILKDHIDKFDECIISAEVINTLESSGESFLKSLSKSGFKSEFKPGLKSESELKQGLEPRLKSEYLHSTSLEINVDDKRKIRFIADYQFGPGSGAALFKGDIKIVKSNKTGKIRHIYEEEKLIATLRASDAVLVLGKEGAHRLHGQLPYPQNRVVVNEESEPFALEGKSIFAKFVIDCDMEIRASEEVLIVNQKDELLAFGKSVLCAEEIIDLNTGQAVKTRKGGF